MIARYSPDGRFGTVSLGYDPGDEFIYLTAPRGVYFNTRGSLKATLKLPVADLVNYHVKVSAKSAPDRQCQLLWYWSTPRQVTLFLSQSQADWFKDDVYTAMRQFTHATINVPAPQQRPSP